MSTIDEAAAAVRSFLRARRGMAGIDPERIHEVKGHPLRASDLETLLQVADEVMRERYGVDDPPMSFAEWRTTEDGVFADDGEDLEALLDAYESYLDGFELTDAERESLRLL